MERFSTRCPGRKPFMIGLAARRWRNASTSIRCETGISVIPNELIGLYAVVETRIAWDHRED